MAVTVIALVVVSPRTWHDQEVNGRTMAVQPTPSLVETVTLSAPYGAVRRTPGWTRG
ncbi:MAG: hypothetical protein WDM88_05255 [Galbitalea sp.]